MTPLATASSPSLLETNAMSNVASVRSASAPRGLAHLIAAVTNAIEAAFEVVAEAAEMSAAARSRFPSAD
ncbi:MAG TPA: hypothetical protein VHX43_09085 [Xanthobacteraceae bacterium]|jgi:hypothetical protein|nr:hypothetical protein [Xanthobacteraceae bacterium]